MNFLDITYLKNGNERQQKAYTDLTQLQIFEKLKKYNPVLAGTIPIGIDLPNSDLDIICQCNDHTGFSSTIKQFFSEEKNFEIRTYTQDHLLVTVANFESDHFGVEIFGQDIPTTNQNAYKHMLIEHEILNKQDAVFKKNIIQLKKEGYKTEPAFAKLLGLQGNPYEALLKIKP